MDDHHDTERLFVGRCALILFIGGLLVPIILAVLVLTTGGADLSSGARDTAYGLSFGVGLVAGLLALILGTIGRRQLSGKIAQIGVIVLRAAWLLMGVVGGAIWFLRSLPEPDDPAGRRRTRPLLLPDLLLPGFGLRWKKRLRQSRGHTLECGDLSPLSGTRGTLANLTFGWRGSGRTVK